MKSALVVFFSLATLAFAVDSQPIQKTCRLSHLGSKGRETYMGGAERIRRRGRIRAFVRGAL